MLEPEPGPEPEPEPPHSVWYSSSPGGAVRGTERATARRGAELMNAYHFYEEIGKGKHSMVYRCRKKKCVEFCAIKSVDKVSRQKVLNEVMVLNSLHHRNVLKFHTW